MAGSSKSGIAPEKDEAGGGESQGNACADRDDPVADVELVPIDSADEPTGPLTKYR